ncbi:CLAVATA3/ESR (CLE)-related protein [Trema orientale]|uniref:CLAVATA3/ESR (CLE)-related protein n=1 Tax=Trema orientale TaxID=63057 RepID=A0A2P5ENB6_TREOI|nr:CLAVATA3/ESR (CLE)-related protein [Trema orientale]
MALKFSQLLFFFLWLSLLLLLFREFRNFKSKFNAKHNISINLMTYSSISNNIHPLITRKVLASSFDFTPFLNHQHQIQQEEEEQRHKKRRRSSPNMPEPSHDRAAGDEESEIDPRYGVEKRRVPTGPNPLHH